MPEYVIAIDQGTTSTRAIAFAKDGTIAAASQREHEQIFPEPGWVEHSPIEIRDNAFAVLKAVRSQLKDGDTIAAIGITNQRETAIVWDRLSGEPIANAIVWQDTRTAERIEQLAAEGGGMERFQGQTGLPLSSYFSASKVQWILEQIPDARERAERGELLFGTPDSWVLWNLTGGVDGGVHVTDVSNASRTLLYNIHELDWDDALLSAFGIPRSMLPQVRSSSEVYGSACAETGLPGVPVAGILGDQQAAAFGQSAFSSGECKNTYGTGNFLLINTGTDAVASEQGLITTIAYQLGEEAVHYALEGSIAVTGSLVQWLRDNLGIIEDSADVERLARSVDDNGGAYIVPAFSGLLAPYWRPDARGVIVGLTRYIHKGHLARAALEATAFQTREVLDAVTAEFDKPIQELRVDGGMIANELLMQFQADVLGIPVVRPRIAETTALGAAYAAGLAVGFWSGLDELRTIWQEQQRWLPQIDQQERERRLRLWKKAVTRSFDWVDEDL